MLKFTSSCPGNTIICCPSGAYYRVGCLPFYFRPSRTHARTHSRLRACARTHSRKPTSTSSGTKPMPALPSAALRMRTREVAAFLALYHVTTSCPRPQGVATAPCRSEALRCMRSRPRSACAAAAVALLMADGGLPMRRALAKVVKARPATDLRQGSQVGGELDRAVRHDGHPSLASIMPSRQHAIIKPQTNAMLRVPRLVPCADTLALHRPCLPRAGPRA
jgi:hypothetical protein